MLVDVWSAMPNHRHIHSGFLELIEHQSQYVYSKISQKGMFKPFNLWLIEYYAKSSERAFGWRHNQSKNQTKPKVTSSCLNVYYNHINYHGNINNNVIIFISFNNLKRTLILKSLFGFNGTILIMLAYTTGLY